MSDTLFTLTTLATTVGHWRFQDTPRSLVGGNHLVQSAGITYETGTTESGLTTADIPTADTFSIAHASAADFDLITADFTVEFWVNTTHTSNSTIVGKGTFGNGWYIEQDSAGILTPVGGDQFTDSIGAINDGEWHYVAVVYEPGTDITIYIDGLFDKARGSFGTHTDDTANFLVGYSTWEGKIDELCITSRVLTSTEIAARYAGHGDPQIFDTSGSAAVTSNLVTSNLSSFDVQLKHTCDHQLTEGAFKLTTCPRCNGTGIYFDMKFDQTGHSSILNIEDKLIQSLEKLVLTSENRFHEDIVLGLHDRIGGPIDEMIGIVKYDLIRGVATMKQNQRGVPNLSARAQIATLNKVEVDNDTATSLRYLVEITTLSGETAELTGTIVLAG